MKILVVHGPNLNLLGRRDKDKYGTITMAEINAALETMAAEMGIEVEFFQSNHEGSIIDFLQRETSRRADGVLTNPGALIRYAYSFRQALIDLDKPTVEIHMSDIDKTGVRREVDLLADIRIDRVTGLKEKSYYEGFKKLVAYIERGKSNAVS